MSKTQLQNFAFAVTELIDHNVYENPNTIIEKLDAGEIVVYLRRKYSDKMPMLNEIDFNGINDIILGHCGGRAAVYHEKYPKVKNGLSALLNLIINAF